MSPVSTSLRTKIAQTARHRCGYCLMQEEVVGMPMEVDHIIPLAGGGSSTEENLWLACPHCNRY
jgi:5-methylcytosine-specific restriction endonuclease McrA